MDSSGDSSGDSMDYQLSGSRSGPASPLFLPLALSTLATPDQATPPTLSTQIDMLAEKNRSDLLACSALQRILRHRGLSIPDTSSTGHPPLAEGTIGHSLPDMSDMDPLKRDVQVEGPNLPVNTPAQTDRRGSLPGHTPTTRVSSSARPALRSTAPCRSDPVPVTALHRHGTVPSCTCSSEALPSTLSQGAVLTGGEESTSGDIESQILSEAYVCAPVPLGHESGTDSCLSIPPHRDSCEPPLPRSRHAQRVRDRMDEISRERAFKRWMHRPKRHREGDMYNSVRWEKEHVKAESVLSERQHYSKGWHEKLGFSKVQQLNQGRSIKVPSRNRGWAASVGDRSVLRFSLALLPSAILEYLAVRTDTLLYTAWAYVALLFCLFWLSLSAVRSITRTMTPGRGKDCSLFLLASWDASLPDPATVRSAYTAKRVVGRRIHDRCVSPSDRETTQAAKHTPPLLVHIISRHMRLVGIGLGLMIGVPIGLSIPYNLWEWSKPTWFYAGMVIIGHMVVTKAMFLVHYLSMSGQPQEGAAIGVLFGNLALGVTALGGYYYHSAELLHMDPRAFMESGSHHMWLWLAYGGPVLLAVYAALWVAVGKLLPKGYVSLAISYSGPHVSAYCSILVFYGILAACIHSHVLITLWTVPLCLVGVSRVAHSKALGIPDSPTSALRTTSGMLMITATAGMVVCVVLGHTRCIMLGPRTRPLWRYLEDQHDFLRSFFGFLDNTRDAAALYSFLGSVLLFMELTLYLSQRNSYTRYHTWLQSEMHVGRLYSRLWALTERRTREAGLGATTISHHGLEHRVNGVTGDSTRSRAYSTTLGALGSSSVRQQRVSAAHESQGSKGQVPRVRHPAPRPSSLAVVESAAQN
ncbi:hypothetical protein KIPB_006492 [Kipferlia bialata]|uniref:Transmembrane protein n=1 Tax=Kipferlia bialata TaxID=797122 RepID=A0A9K3CZ21_9EUKA|nr:hypothetical protein KIPB_006492 [Kipferlia bialata]|eukprot:g6492.t1